MELKPGYKQTEVGVIPENWSVVPLGKLYKFSNGVNADKAAYGKGLRFINVLEPISYSHIRGPEIPGLVELPSQVAAAYTVNSGDIVFNRTSETDTELGMAAVYLGDEKVVFGGFVIRGQAISPVLDPVYAGYALRGEMVRAQIIPLGQGAVRANIGQESLRKVLVLVPPENEQRLIVEALQDIDCLLSNIQDSLYKKRQIKQAAMQELLTGKRRLPGFEGEWEVKKLGDIAEITMGQSPGSHNYNKQGRGLPLIQGNADIKNRETVPRAFTTQITKRGFNGDTLMTVRAPVGEVSRANIDVCLGRGVCAIRFPSDFLYHFLVSLEPAWAKHSKGSTFDSVNAADIKAVDVYLPCDSLEQNAIAESLGEMDAELTVLEIRLAKAHAIKQGMLQQLLTGKIRLT